LGAKTIIVGDDVAEVIRVVYGVVAAEPTQVEPAFLLDGVFVYEASEGGAVIS
jgi:hypothetical protein